MRQIPGRTLWIGNARDGRDARAIFEAGIAAVVELAHEEPAGASGATGSASVEPPTRVTVLAAKPLRAA